MRRVRRLLRRNRHLLRGDRRLLRRFLRLWQVRNQLCRHVLRRARHLLRRTWYLWAVRHLGVLLWTPCKCERGRRLGAGWFWRRLPARRLGGAALHVVEVLGRWRRVLGDVASQSPPPPLLHGLKPLLPLLPPRLRLFLFAFLFGLILLLPLQQDPPMFSLLYLFSTFLLHALAFLVLPPLLLNHLEALLLSLFLLFPLSIGRLLGGQLLLIELAEDLLGGVRGGWRCSRGCRQLRHLLCWRLKPKIELYLLPLLRVLSRLLRLLSSRHRLRLLFLDVFPVHCHVATPLFAPRRPTVGELFLAAKRSRV
mmetsp:Transcript_31455/g.86505  ORF Transcript_31455/g.86505 Transcript_31455/m.86505 type:complete len:309 (-) Transcript_31455:295-1221(-)